MPGPYVEDANAQYRGAGTLADRNALLLPVAGDSFEVIDLDSSEHAGVTTQYYTGSAWESRPGRVVHTFTLSGDAVVQTYQPPDRAEDNFTIERVTGDFDIAPTGQAMIIDILIGTTSIFTSAGNRLTIPASNDNGSTNNIDLPDVGQNNKIRVKVAQIGSIVAGGNGTIRVVGHKDP